MSEYTFKDIVRILSSYYLSEDSDLPTDFNNVCIKADFDLAFDEVDLSENAVICLPYFMSGWNYPSIAEITGLSERQVAYAMRKLAGDLLEVLEK